MKKTPCRLHLSSTQLLQSHTSWAACQAPRGLAHSGFHLPHTPGGHCWPRFGLHQHVCCMSRLRGWTRLGPGLARCCGHRRAPRVDNTSSLSQAQTASPTLDAYSVSLYPDSSDRDLADDWALNFLLLCLGSQSCRKYSALLESLWLNKTCKDFWQMLMHYPNKLVEHTSEPA